MAIVAYMPSVSMDPSDPSLMARKLEKVRERREKENMKGESSHSSIFNMHPGQPSSLIDPYDMTQEDRKLIYHAFLFPFDFEFTKEELVRLWIAQGLFQVNQSPNDRVEDDASAKFDSFVRQELLVPFRVGYKLHRSVESSFGRTISDGGYFRISDGKFPRILFETVLHLCLLCYGLDNTKLNTVTRSMNLRSLFILPYRAFYLRDVPYDLFLRFRDLIALNLSCNRFSELPSSMANLKSLRYIDLSYTHITELPDWIDNLQDLQTLKLKGCIFLQQLPDGMRNLTNLRHLDFEVRQLRSMPPGIGNLTHLQTLSAFLIGKEEGCRIRELRNLGNLTGSFCICWLENVLDLKDVREAALINKNYITKLELSWAGGKAENSPKDEDILEHLQPSLRLQELRILYYGGSKLPTWIGDRSYECLVDLYLYRFDDCRLLPSIGELPSLRILKIVKMNQLERINKLFCRYGSESSQDHHAFPHLKTLTFEDMPKWVEWTGVQSGDFPSLRQLNLNECPKLKSIPSLSFFRESLKTLELVNCQSIMPFFLDGGVTVLLDRLRIKECPELRRWFNDRPQGQYWPRIADLIWIDDGLWSSEEE